MRAAPTIAIIGLLLAACGDEPAPVALEDFSEAAPDALCEWAVRCRHMPDRQTCERFIDPKTYDVRRALDAIDQGRLSYDPAAAGACVEATVSAHCLAVPFADESCERMFTGLVEEGGACTSAFECAGGADCEDRVCDAQCCLGVCGAPVPVDPPVPKKKIGEPCVVHFECVDEAYCETDGRCTANPTEEGQRCLYGCARGDLYCDVDSLTCKANAALGETCDPEGASAPPCDTAWSYCDGTCVPRPGPGEVCDDADRRCVPTATCQAGTCAARGTAGDPCAESRECDVACDRTRGECVAYETCEI